jgi:hypothetical protein
VPQRFVTGGGALVALRPMVVGAVHGLAGSAAAALLVLSTIHSTRWALVYLLIFGVGTDAGMMLVTTVIALPFAYTARRFENVNAWLAGVTALASIALGTVIAYQLIATHGAFSAAPNWTAQ